MNENCEENSDLFFFFEHIKLIHKNRIYFTQYNSKSNSFKKDSSFLHMDKSDANKLFCSVTGLTFFLDFQYTFKTLSWNLMQLFKVSLFFLVLLLLLFVFFFLRKTQKEKTLEAKEQSIVIHDLVYLLSAVHLMEQASINAAV